MGSWRVGSWRVVNSVRDRAVALEFSRLELPARTGDETDRLVRADLAGVDLAIRQDDDDARSDAHRNDARRRGARAVKRPAPEHLEIRGCAPRARKARIDKRRQVAALAHNERELGALRFPFR